MVSGLFDPFLQIFERLFEAVGTTIIIYGGLKAVFRLFICAISKRPYRLEDIRRDFTNKILFGLEFYIIVAVFVTMRNPSSQDLLSLGAIVFIRTVLGYFLTREIKDYKFD